MLELSKSVKWFMENENVRQIVGMLKGLGLLPLKYVKKGM